MYLKGFQAELRERFVQLSGFPATLRGFRTMSPGQNMRFHPVLGGFQLHLNGYAPGAPYKILFLKNKPEIVFAFFFSNSFIFVWYIT